MADLTVDDYNKGIGAIVMNLQALESVIRFFFFRKNDEKHPFPKPLEEGDITPNSSLVKHQQLRKWIRKYNSCLSKDELKKFSISEDTLDVRDALAHGRLVAPDPPSLPYTLWNFKEPSDGNAEVRFCKVLTAEWLKETAQAIFDDKEKVVACAKARSYKGF